MRPKEFRIALCDDEEEIGILLKNMITTYGSISGRRFKVDIFLTTEMLYQKLLSENQYDLIFLDILFTNQKLDGIALGVLIREKIKDTLTEIIYISNCRSRIEDIFDARPRRFISKPITEEKVIKSLELMIHDYENHTKAFFEYHVGSYACRIDVHDIIFMQINKREIHIKTIYKSDYFNGRIRDCHERLRQYGFVMANKSCLVNYYHISDLSTDAVLLSSGDVIHFNAGCYRALDQLHRENRNRYEPFLLERLNLAANSCHGV